MAHSLSLAEFNDVTMQELLSREACEELKIHFVRPKGRPHDWSGSVSSNRVSAISVEVVTSGECLWGEGLVWLIRAVVCLLAATAGPMSISTGSGWPHLRCSTTGSCQSTATSEIVKTRCLWSTMEVALYKNPTFTFTFSHDHYLRSRLAVPSCDSTQHRCSRFVVVGPFESLGQ